MYENTKNSGTSGGFKLIAVAEYSQTQESGVHILYRPFSIYSGARFGMSLLSLGRFDSDKYEDFAVGAPYDNSGEGVVYIYRGSKDFWAKQDSKGKDIKYLNRPIIILNLTTCLLFSTKKLFISYCRTSNYNYSKKL